MRDNIFYYCSTHKLSNGSIVEKGSHPLDDIGVPFFKNSYLLVFNELLLENIRLKKFNSKPSRITSIFVSPCLKNLDYFIKIYRNNWPVYKYKVEGVTDKYNYHIGTLDYHNYLKKRYNNQNIEKIIQQVAFKDFEKMAENYWDGIDKMEIDAEIVIDTPIKIIERLQ